MIHVNTDSYSQRQLAATCIWNHDPSRPRAVYVQKVSDDEWRVSGIHAEILGYVNIRDRTIQFYGSNAITAA